MASGGKREGAGRKKVLTYETTVIKIPLPIKDLLKSIVDYEISYHNQTGDFDYGNRYQVELSNPNQIDLSYGNQIAKIKAILDKYENESLCNNSPRWQHAKRLIGELKLALDKA
jgi:hypothetical protein